MEFSHSLEEANAVAETALGMMRQRDIPPHPHNYSLWYSYACRENPQLNQALEFIFTTRQRPSEEEVHAVFRTFCASAPETVPVQLVADRMEAELATVLAAAETTANAACSYGSSLEEASDVVEYMRTGKDLRLLILAILRETRAIAKQSRGLGEQLRQSLQEVGRLRQQLGVLRLEEMTDALTGLANRKMFDHILGEAAREAIASETPLSVFMLDIDHFKTFNAAHGNTTGDQVLKLLAVTLKQSLKGQDTVARYDGGEFAIILPRTRLRDAAALAEGIRQRVASKCVVHLRTGDQLGRVSVSIGVAQFNFDEPLHKFLARANHALHFAKRFGRNRVVGDSDSGSLPLPDAQA